MRQHTIPIIAIGIVVIILASYIYVHEVQAVVAAPAVGLSGVTAAEVIAAAEAASLTGAATGAGVGTGTVVIGTGGAATATAGLSTGILLTGGTILLVIAVVGVGYWIYASSQEEEVTTTPTDRQTEDCKCLPPRTYTRGDLEFYAGLSCAQVQAYVSTINALGFRNEPTMVIARDLQGPNCTRNDPLCKNGICVERTTWGWGRGSKAIEYVNDFSQLIAVSDNVITLHNQFLSGNLPFPGGTGTGPSIPGFSIPTTSNRPPANNPFSNYRDAQNQTRTSRPDLQTNRPLTETADYAITRAAYNLQAARGSPNPPVPTFPGTSPPPISPGLDNFLRGFSDNIPQGGGCIVFRRSSVHCQCTQTKKKPGDSTPPGGGGGGNTGSGSVLTTPSTGSLDVGGETGSAAGQTETTTSPRYQGFVARAQTITNPVEILDRLNAELAEILAKSSTAASDPTNSRTPVVESTTTTPTRSGLV